MTAYEDELAEFDPDIVLITNYLAKELPPAEMEAVEQRLEEDEAFFDKVWPLVQAWELPVRLKASAWEEADTEMRQETTVTPLSSARKRRSMPAWGWVTLAAAASVAAV